MRDAAQAHPSV